MNALLLTAALLALAALAYRMGSARAVAVAGGDARSLNSRPGYHGAYLAMWCGLPALVALVAWLLLEPAILRALMLDSLAPDLRAMPPGRLELLLADIRALAAGGAVGRAPEPALLAAAEAYARMRDLSLAAVAVVGLSAAAGGLALGRRAIAPGFRARAQVERVIRILLLMASVVAILVTVGIVLSLLFEAIRFFRLVSPIEFLLGLHWSPQTALRADQVGSSGAFGAVPVFAGTLLITVIAMGVAAPVGLFSAIYMAEYATPRTRAVAKPALEVLAGIPTVVYGFFAALSVGPFLRGLGDAMGLDVASESALAAGLVMGVMIIPFVSSLSDDVIAAVPQSLRDGAYALGATKSEAITQVVLPAALHGIVSALLLAVSRAIGETMIVVMAAGLAAKLTANPLEAVTTVTVQVVALLVGDQEFDSAKTLAAFALALTLFLATLALNVVALAVVRRYREQYD